MQLTRKALVILLLGLASFLGWKNLSRAAQETVVLRTGGSGIDDHYATLWAVDNASFVWIRAESPSRRWLGSVRSNPNVDLRRGGRNFAYRATVFDTPRSRAYVDPLFRAKYGFADRLRELLGPRDTIPIRLEPR